MAPPDVGSEVFIKANGRITKHNDDGTFNVKVGSGPGRPFKKSLADVVPPPVPLMAAVPAALEDYPEPHAQGSKEDEKGRRGLLWGVLLTVFGAIGIGIFHSVGSRILDAVWPHIEPLLKF